MTQASGQAGGTAAAGRDIGRAARTAVPRSSLGEWSAPEGRPDPVDTLQAQAADRVPELIPLRYERMLASPFAFYRGGAAVMALDLGTRPRTNLQVQLAGDAHLANFGGFAAADRSMIFDLNDFDETLPGPFEWDVQRLAASFEVAGRANDFTAGQRATVVGKVVATYRQALQDFAAATRLDVWYARIQADEIADRWGTGFDAARVAAFKRTIAKGRQRTSRKAVSRYTRVDQNGQLAVISQPPFVVPLRELFHLPQQEIRHEALLVLDEYRNTLAEDRQVLVGPFQPIDVARKVVGVGSVGTRCFIVLLVAADDPTDDLVLQVKEASASVLEAVAERSPYSNHGQRVVEGQRLMQASSDVLLGWTRVAGQDGVERDFYVRQMWDWKTSAEIDGMDPATLGVYGCVCGWTLARAHARSGDRHALAAYLGSGTAFDRAMQEFAASYADQNQRDFEALRTAVADGRLPADDTHANGVQ
jgi:uncharacterized protein (DUF2252 family)